jgi:hypothetical protein
MKPKNSPLVSQSLTFDFISNYLRGDRTFRNLSSKICFNIIPQFKPSLFTWTLPTKFLPKILISPVSAPFPACRFIF